MFLEWENNSGKLQIISGKFQNNAINNVKQISLSHAITDWNFQGDFTICPVNLFWKFHKDNGWKLKLGKTNFSKKYIYLKYAS